MTTTDTEFTKSMSMQTPCPDSQYTKRTNFTNIFVETKKFLNCFSLCFYGAQMSKIYWLCAFTNHIYEKCDIFMTDNIGSRNQTETAIWETAPLLRWKWAEFSQR